MNRFANVNIQRDGGFSDDDDMAMNFLSNRHQKMQQRMSGFENGSEASAPSFGDAQSDFGGSEPSQHSVGRQVPENDAFNNFMRERQNVFQSEAESEAPSDNGMGGFSDAASEAASEVSSYAGSDLSPEEEMKKKRFILFKLKRYQKQGYDLSRMYTIDSPLSDLQAEYESIRKEATLNQGLKVSKNILVSTCTAIEYLNNRFDPVDAVLDGWSEDVAEDVESGDYDEVLEELYDKYYDKVNVGPEMKLLMMVGGSAVKFHISNTLLKTMVPNSEAMLKSNPGLKDDIMGLVNKTKQGQQINTAMGGLTSGSVGGLGKKSDYKFEGPDDADDILRELEMDADNEEGNVLNMDF
jgi:hypothetical protein